MPKTQNPLTRREREVLQAVSQGLASSGIATTLEMSPRTADAHKANIRNKLSVRTTAQAVAKAVRMGWIR